MAVQQTLSPRRQRVLGYIVDDYVTSAQPVASEAIARRLGSVSSATVRNDMAALEDEGYITQPHTSAGRVPSDKGYRYFVEVLMNGEELSESERRTITHQFHQVEGNVDQWTALAASVLARVTGNAAVVTSPRWRSRRVKRLELVPLRERTALLVIVLDKGLVRQQILTLDEQTQSSELEQVANRLNLELFGLSRGEVAQRLEQETGLTRTVLQAVIETMSQLDEQATGSVHHDGISKIMEQPEFQHVERLRQLLELLQAGGLFSQLLSLALQRNDLMVSIGSENPWQPLRDFTLVLSRYGHSDNAVGVLGVVGPTRMQYRRTISGVRYLSEVMDSLIEQV